jgi:hypothetical protein
VLVLRSLWLRKNEFVFQGKFSPPSHIILKARNMAADCSESVQEDPIDSVTEAHTIPK